jgi:hypothetical protein
MLWIAGVTVNLLINGSVFFLINLSLLMTPKKDYLNHPILKIKRSEII